MMHSCIKPSPTAGGVPSLYADTGPLDFATAEALSFVAFAAYELEQMEQLGGSLPESRKGSEYSKHRAHYVEAIELDTGNSKLHPDGGPTICRRRRWKHPA